MRLVAALAVLVVACSSDDHSAIEHHHVPLPPSKHLTSAEREDIRVAIARGLARAKVARRDPDVMGGVVGGTIRSLHAVLDGWVIDGPRAAGEPIILATDQIDACLGSAPLTGRFRVEVGRDGKATSATVVGVASHRGCVEDVLRALAFPTHAIAYNVSARIVYN